MEQVVEQKKKKKLVDDGFEEIVKYKARDGKVFDKERDCKAYEEYLKIIEDYNKTFNPKGLSNQMVSDSLSDGSSIDFAEWINIRRVDEASKEILCQYRTHLDFRIKWPTQPGIFLIMQTDDGGDNSPTEGRIISINELIKLGKEVTSYLTNIKKGGE